MNNLTKQERRDLRRQNKKERKERERLENLRENKKNNLKIYVLIALIIVSLGYFVFLISASPGPYDNFAKCLSEKGMMIYGNDWCQYTQNQMSLFGKSFDYLNYVKCDDNKQLCKQKGVQITPTWEINGKTYSGIQSFETLSELSGCKL